MPRKKGEKKAVPFVDGLRTTEIQDIPLDEIKTDDKGFQYRLSATIGDLKHSLSQEGQREPIDLTGSKPYRIIDGFRRMESVRALGWKSIRALVHRGISDEEAHKLAFIKNVVRKNLSPMDKAHAIFQAKQRGMKPANLSEYFSLSEKQIARYERLLSFPAEIQRLIEKETLPMGHAKVLADFRVKDKDLSDWLKRIKDEHLSAKQLERELKKSSGAKLGGKVRLYMKKDKNGFRMYPFAISRDSPQVEKDKVMKVLQEAIEILRA